MHPARIRKGRFTTNMVRHSECVDAYSRYPGRSFDEFEPELGRDWASKRGSSTLEWDGAKHATRDAWQRVSDTAERALPGDSDRDGK